MSYPVAKQLKSGAWTCRVRVNGEDVSVTKQTKKEVEKEAYDIKIGIIEIRNHPVSSITVGEVVDRYIQYKSGLPKTSPSTIRGGYTIIRRFTVTDVSILNWKTMLNTSRCGVIDVRDVGKTVFLTREEALEAMKK